MNDAARASAQFIPVTVGSKHGARTAKRLFWQHGLSSHLFTPHITLFHRLTPWLICHRLPASPDLAVLALCDLAAEIEAADRIPLLYLCDDAPLLDQEKIRHLESCYILCRQVNPPIMQQGGQAV